MECNGIIIYFMGYTEKNKKLVYFEGDNLQHLKNG